MTTELDKESVTNQTHGDFLFLSIFHLLSEKGTGYSSFYFPRVKIRQGIKGNKSQMKAFQEEKSPRNPGTHPRCFGNKILWESMELSHVLD